MNIDTYLKNISNKLNDKNIQTAFNLIKELTVRYPQNVKLSDTFRINNIKYQKQMPIDIDEIKRLYKLNESKNIDELVNKLLKIDPQNAYVFSYLGDMRGKKGDFKNARIFQEKAILFNPYEMMFYVNLSNTYRYLGLLGLSNKFH